ncbi:thymidylate kinase [Streptomonospora sp. PA3]|uniref:dTMP kinase n=1 Tax=Streptomonospora sp. PA3 TaxID=2607326 RepID=UPI001642DF0F|nr:thymidylate kinase [Streptomonospora sp. PA3]
MLVAVAGTDGAGKSTVTRAVAEFLAGSGCAVHHVDRWDVVDNPHYPAAGFLASDVTYIRHRVADMPPTARLLFLMWLIDMALEAWEGDARTGALLVDGYWMKHAASEVAYGLDQGWVEGVVDRLPQASVTLYLRVSPEVAWARKTGDIVPYECGMDPSCAEESFLAHQRRIQNLLDRWAAQRGWTVIDADRPYEDVVADVTRYLAAAVEHGEAGPGGADPDGSAPAPPLAVHSGADGRTR